MLSCIYNGKPFIANDKSLSMEQKYELADKKQFLCPCCHRPVFYCHEGLKIAHFVHYEVEDCPEGTFRSYDYSNTGKHERLTEIFVDWVKTQFPDIEVIPDYMINRELKTDIYFELGSVKIAIEIQFKRIPNPNFIERRELYKKNGIKDIWFFVTEGENYPVGSPFHRTYYHDNKRKLYFYQSNVADCKVYKGFANEKWEKIGSHTLLNYVSVEVPLDHIKIKNDGVLIIPELYNIYLQKIKEKREKNKLRRSAEKEYRERQKYKTSNNFSSFIPRQAYSPITGEYKVISESKPQNSLNHRTNQYKNVI